MEKRDFSVKVFFNGTEYSFDFGFQAYIFHTGICNEFHKKYGQSALLKYVTTVQDCYIADSNRTPLGALADYIAEHWIQAQQMGKRELLDVFYESII